MKTHEAFVEGLEQVRRFVTEMTSVGALTKNADEATTGSESRVVGVHRQRTLDHLAVAFEDIPADVHHLVKMVLMRPTDDLSHRPLNDAVEDILDVLENIGGDALGHVTLVTEQLSQLHILNSLRRVHPYTYKVDAKLVRGSRPTDEKLETLLAAGVGTTINLCKEMRDGDQPMLESARIPSAEMRSIHIGIIDNTAPTSTDINQFLEVMENAANPVYVHCQAGIGRTGVMVGCYRISKGWPIEAALREARNFGCQVPDQLRTIEDFGSRTSSTTGLSASADQLHQSVEGNLDPLGLTRVAQGLVSADTGSPPSVVAREHT
jgi:protein tyrosine phosphatase (PTP) superfamily phosphohydrolase (DUF442 family)